MRGFQGLSKGQRLSQNLPSLLSRLGKKQLEEKERSAQAMARLECGGSESPPRPQECLASFRALPRKLRCQADYVLNLKGSQIQDCIRGRTLKLDHKYK